VGAAERRITQQGDGSLCLRWYTMAMVPVTWPGGYLLNWRPQSGNPAKGYAVIVKGAPNSNSRSAM
jgi:hypothetical protein